MSSNPCESGRDRNNNIAINAEFAHFVPIVCVITNELVVG